MDIEDLGEDSQRLGQKIPQHKRKTIGDIEYTNGTKERVFVKSFGCAHNTSDGEYICGLLADAGYRLTKDMEMADACVFVSCTVKGPSEDSFYNLIKMARAASKPVVAAGCVPQGEGANEALAGVGVIGVMQIQNVVPVLEEVMMGRNPCLLARSRYPKDLPPLNLPKMTRNKYIDVIPISQGCLNRCTYCKTKHARGDLVSYPIHEVVDRVRALCENGVMEIRMTSEDVGAYGIDQGTSIVELLKATVQVLEKYPNTVLRIGMTNPPYILGHKEEVAKILNHPQVFSFLHIPVQSGSDSVLMDMRRDYSVEDFRCLVDYLREHVSDLSLATDFICGYPTETDSQFDESITLIEAYKFPIINISQMYARPGTMAATLKPLPSHIRKARSKRATELFMSYQCYDHLVGQVTRVVITELAADGVHLVGHTKGYVQVLLDQDENVGLGCIADVQITKAAKFYVTAKVISVAYNANSNTSPNTQRIVTTSRWPVKQGVLIAGAAIVALACWFRWRRR